MIRSGDWKFIDGRGSGGFSDRGVRGGDPLADGAAIVKLPQTARSGRTAVQYEKRSRETRTFIPIDRKS